MTADAASITRHILAPAGKHSGADTTGREDRLIAAELRCTGHDSIYLLEDLDAAYGVDLRPLIAVEAEQGSLRKRTVKVGRDITARQIAEYAAEKLRQ